VSLPSPSMSTKFMLDTDSGRKVILKRTTCVFNVQYDYRDAILSGWDWNLGVTSNHASSTNYTKPFQYVHFYLQHINSVQLQLCHS
jgi:hypothetical protein